MIKSLTFREGCCAYYESFMISLRSIKDVMLRGLVSYVLLCVLLGFAVGLTSSFYDGYYSTFSKVVIIFEGLGIFTTIMLFFLGLIDIACRVVNNEKITMIDFFKIYIQYKLWLKSLAVIAFPFIISIITCLLFWGSVSIVTAIKIKNTIPFFFAEGILGFMLFAILLSYYYIVVGTIYSLYLISPNGQNLIILDAVKQSFTGMLKNVRAILAFICCSIANCLVLFVVVVLLVAFPFAIASILSANQAPSIVRNALSASEVWCGLISSIGYFIFYWTSLVFFCITGKKIFINEHNANSQPLT